MPLHPGLHLTFLDGLLHEEYLMTTVLLRLFTKWTNDFPILLTKELEFLSMVHTEIFLLPLLWAYLGLSEPLHDAGQMLIKP